MEVFPSKHNRKWVTDLTYFLLVLCDKMVIHWPIDIPICKVRMKKFHTLKMNNTVEMPLPHCPLTLSQVNLYKEKCAWC